MAMPRPEVLARRLLGRTPDDVEPLVVWDHRATFRCTIGADTFVCKADDDIVENKREVDGHTRAAAAGIPVPELIAVEPGGLAMRFVPGVALSGRSSEAAWRDAGRLLRRVHEIERPAPRGACFPPGATWAESVVAEVETELARGVRDYGVATEVAQRVRVAIENCRPALENAPMAFVHGDLQPDHVLLDPETDRVVSIIDWSDFGDGDPAWDIAILTLDDPAPLPALLHGYGAAPDLVEVYRAVRWAGEVCWLMAHDMIDVADQSRAQLAAWRP